MLAILLMIYFMLFVGANTPVLVEEFANNSVSDAHVKRSIPIGGPEEEPPKVGRTPPVAPETAAISADPEVAPAEEVSDSESPPNESEPPPKSTTGTGSRDSSSRYVESGYVKGDLPKAEPRPKVRKVKRRPTPATCRVYCVDGPEWVENAESYDLQFCDCTQKKPKIVLPDKDNLRKEFKLKERKINLETLFRDILDITPFKIAAILILFSVIVNNYLSDYLTWLLIIEAIGFIWFTVYTRSSPFILLALFLVGACMTRQAGGTGFLSIALIYGLAGLLVAVYGKAEWVLLYVLMTYVLRITAGAVNFGYFSQTDAAASAGITLLLHLCSTAFLNDIRLVVAEEESVAGVIIALFSVVNDQSGGYSGLDTIRSAVNWARLNSPSPVYEYFGHPDEVYYMYFIIALVLRMSALVAYQTSISTMLFNFKNYNKATDAFKALFIVKYVTSVMLQSGLRHRSSETLSMRVMLAYITFMNVLTNLDIYIVLSIVYLTSCLYPLGYPVHTNVSSSSLSALGKQLVTESKKYFAEVGYEQKKAEKEGKKDALLLAHKPKGQANKENKKPPKPDKAPGKGGSKTTDGKHQEATKGKLQTSGPPATNSPPKGDVPQTENITPESKLVEEAVKPWETLQQYSDDPNDERSIHKVLLNFPFSKDDEHAFKGSSVTIKSSTDHGSATLNSANELTTVLHVFSKPDSRDYIIDDFKVDVHGMSKLIPRKAKIFFSSASPKDGIVVLTFDGEPFAFQKSYLPRYTGELTPSAVFCWSPRGYNFWRYDKRESGLIVYGFATMETESGMGIAGVVDGVGPCWIGCHAGKLLESWLNCGYPLQLMKEENAVVVEGIKTESRARADDPIEARIHKLKQEIVKAIDSSDEELLNRLYVKAEKLVQARLAFLNETDAPKAAPMTLPRIEPIMDVTPDLKNEEQAAKPKKKKKRSKKEKKERNIDSEIEKTDKLMAGGSAPLALPDNYPHGLTKSKIRHTKYRVVHGKEIDHRILSWLRSAPAGVLKAELEKERVELLRVADALAEEVRHGSPDVRATEAEANAPSDAEKNHRSEDVAEESACNRRRQVSISPILLPSAI
jgi:hypothetical protein